MERRVAIVTGAGNGLGAAFARALAADGTAVVVNNRRHLDRPFSAQIVVDEITAHGGVAITDDHAVDAPGSAAAIVATATAAFGRLDALVLNAGISGPALKIGTGETNLAEVMTINFFANTALVEAALPSLLASPAGRIVFVSSSAGLHGLRGRAAYAASKGALNAYALSLADELRRTPIRVNVVAPYAATRMAAGTDGDTDPLLDPASPAPVVAWLCDPATDRNGEVWVAGAGQARRARLLEGPAGAIADLPRDADALAAFGNGRGFSDAMAAFTDFYGLARARAAGDDA